MKNIFFTSLLILTSIFSKAQYGGLCSIDEIKNTFLKSELLILRTGNAEFDLKLEVGFEKYWTHTKYRFIDSYEKEDKKNWSFSFLVPYTATIDDGIRQTYHRYGIYMGGREFIKRSQVANIVLDNFGREKSVVDAADRAETMAKFMNDFIQMRLDGKPISTAEEARVRYTSVKVYNQKSKIIKSKILLVDKTHLLDGRGEVMFSESEFKAIYAGKVEFVDHETYIKEIEKNNPDYCYFLPVFERMKYIFVVDCESGEIVYNGYGYGMIFTKKDLKLLNKVVGF